MASIACAVFGIAAGTIGASLSLSWALDEINDVIYMSGNNVVDVDDPMNGVPHLPITDDDEQNEDKIENKENTLEALRNPHPEDEKWKNTPHIKAIRTYGRNRSGFYNLYCTLSPTSLNTIYMNWLQSVPNDSPLHIRKNYAETFVELHRTYFVTGLTGRIVDRLS